METGVPDYADKAVYWLKRYRYARTVASRRVQVWEPLYPMPGSKGMRLTISVERLCPSGALLLATVAGGRRISFTYYGYTIREARSEFREYVKSEVGV